MNETKRIGIVCDNYKVKLFMKLLKAFGLTKVTSFPFTHATTGLQIEVPASEYNPSKKAVNEICTKVELHYKRSN